MFFVEVGLISFTFTLTSIQVGMLALLVVGPGGLFLDAGVWVHLHPSRLSLDLHQETYMSLIPAYSSLIF